MNIPTPDKIPSKDDLLRTYGYNDPLIYEAYKYQVQFDLTDEQMLCLLVLMLLDRHEHLDRAYKNLLARTPPSPFVTMQT